MQGAAAVSAKPYIVGQWVRGEGFYGREALIAEILEGPRHQVWLLGTRRVGKTSMLKQLEHLTAPGEQGFFPLFWDFQGAENLEEMGQDFDDVLLDVEDRLQDVGIALAEVSGGDVFASLGKLRRALRAKKRTLLLLCDEVEELIRLADEDPALLRKLRHALQSTEGIRSVLASSLRLWVLAERREDTSPFLHGFLPPLYIHRLLASEARSLIRQDHLATGSRPRLAARVVDAIRRRCDDHPYLVQLVATRLLELGDFEDACEDVAADPTVSHFFAVDFDTLPGAEQSILRWVSQRPSVSSDSIRTSLPVSSSDFGGGLQRLERLGILRRDEDRRFTVANPFFRRWLRERPPENTASSGGSRASESKNLVTAIVERVQGSGRAGEHTPDELLPLVYDELRRVARGYLRRERPGHTLQATALVHEAYLKLVDQTRVSWQGRTHFFAVGARAMRRLLVDHARGRRRAKRGGDQQQVTLNEAVTPDAGPNLDFEQLLTLDAALEKLHRLDERWAQIVELRFFAGLTIVEVARHLGLSKRTVNTEWARARAWLAQELMH